MQEQTQEQTQEQRQEQPGDQPEEQTQGQRQEQPGDQPEEQTQEQRQEQPGDQPEEQALEQWVAGEPDNEVAQLSRRRFLTGMAAGGAAGLAVAAGTGAAVWNVAEAKAQVALEEADAEIARLQGLVDLYQDLEKIGLDAILQGGMAAMALPLGAVEAGARALHAGLEAIEEALGSLEEALPSARESVLWLEGRVSALAAGITKLETTLGQALKKATDNPIGEALTDFASMILDNLPFGLGDRIRDVLDGLVELVTSVDDLVAGINTRLLQPLREQWFSAEEGKGVAAAVIEPLIEHVLDPLEAHLAELASLADAWQMRMVAPAEQALEQRARIREQIARYPSEPGAE